ncbi:outer membrane protein Iml2/Tetratricopeptide repeat protein 39 [Vararia minispora EC-137]|uniref:Outer membrane protein Iml2/Tetratricopeptide repeat protein 39 n=1 Tax=Vararia minispora EC-137 TaxID=1314806 RepID=A0ACB8QSE0_9AGAM|nr:outer membrane protein Iml2/Tetratricopeptide repeat protein 39 [Vararia minispora EC-137]
MAAEARKQTLEWLQDAQRGFDRVFDDGADIARDVFKAHPESPFHMLGLAALSFLEAALSFETSRMAEATSMLQAADAAARKQLKAAKSLPQHGRFSASAEWDLLVADCTILIGMTHALSESYVGYLQCLYAMNNAHSKFTKLYKLVFPIGLDTAPTPALSRRSSKTSISAASASTAASAPAATVTVTAAAAALLSPPPRRLFGRWGGGGASAPVSPAATPVPIDDGPIEELVVSGTAFGYGLFQLVLSLLPQKVKSVVGFFGLGHDRRLALRALAVSAAKNDVHAVFAGLALMTYHGVVLLSSGYQADEKRILRQYREIVDRLEGRYPSGTLWILNRAKIHRMENDPDNAIAVLRAGLAPNPARPRKFVQAESLLVFELAWILLAGREYELAAKEFLHITEINTWSHATYFFLAGGCLWRVGQYDRAQALFDGIPAAIDKRKFGGRDLPFEVFIKKKLAFWKAKQRRLTGSEDGYVKAISVNPAEVWNNHQRIKPAVAEQHIRDWLALHPPISTPTPYASSPPSPPPAYPSPPPPLDTPDELALRDVLLGVAHRTAGHAAPARTFLETAHARQPLLAVSTWVGGVALFELAVLELLEARGAEPAAGASDAERRQHWRSAIAAAGKRLEAAQALLGSEIDLASRLESRIAMLRDEIALKKELVGL